ncbi:MAG: hypothetical protein IKC87_03625 [Clostridia bacterium]|nr:hypothetical protein [Clostridia bacterium]
MKIAIVGSRSLVVDNIGAYLPNDCTEIVTGGARGVDTSAIEYAEQKRIRLTVFNPKYKLYGKAAPLIRNRDIVEYADEIIAFYDGNSRGTLYTINYAKKIGKPCTIIILDKK